MKHNTSIRSQIGATLLEAIAYLGIAAFVILGAVSLLGRAFGASATNAALQQIASLYTNTKKIYLGTGTYGAAANTEILKAVLGPAAAIPTTLKITKDGTGAVTAVLNGWSGAVTVTSDSVANATKFIITYNGLPKDACLELATTFQSSEWSKVTINGTDATTIPVPPPTAATSCSSASNSLALTSLN